MPPASLDVWGHAPRLHAVDERFELGRVIRQERTLLTVQVEGGQVLASPAGRLSGAAANAEALPVVGDWVQVTRGGVEGTRHIVSVLPRASLLSRKAPGDVEQPQPLAANVDRVLVVVGLDLEPNLRRIERSLTWIWNGGALPVVVLNKSDLAEDLPAALSAVGEVAPGVEVVACSAATGEGLEELRALLPARNTALLLGPSGVGKSSLLNALLGEGRFAVGEVREEDGKGRHTTTNRQLVPLPWGALLVDVPGTRELGLWADGDGVAETFSDVAGLSKECRFRDCQHYGEPGCAVRAAVEDGTLPFERLESFHKLLRELERLAAKSDVQSAQELKKKHRALTNAAWTHSRKKRE